MVATLVKLKWRLTLNALTKNVWAIIGTVFGALYGVGALAMVLAGAVGLGLKTDADVIMLVLGALGALLVAGWAVVPLLVTGVDSTLDPRAMAAWATPSRGLALGLVAAGALGIPGCITAAVCLIPVLTWLLAGQLAAALLALLCAPAALATCVLLSRIIVTAAGISSSRRGRETTAIIAFVAFMVCTQLPNLIPRLLGDDPTDILQPLGTLARVMGLSPFGWAFAAPGVMATGSVPAALALAIGAWILPVILLPLWQRVVNKAMTSPGTSHTRTRAYAADGAGSDAQHRGLPDVLPWARRLSAALPAPVVRAARRRAQRIRAGVEAAFRSADLLLLPTMIDVPGGAHDLRGKGWAAAMLASTPTVSNTAIFNVSGHPAMSVHAGFSPEGLPIGAQLVARTGREDLLLTVAGQLEDDDGGLCPPWPGR